MGLSALQNLAHSFAFRGWHFYALAPSSSLSKSLAPIALNTATMREGTARGLLQGLYLQLYTPPCKIRCIYTRTRMPCVAYREWVCRRAAGGAE